MRKWGGGGGGGGERSVCSPSLCAAPSWRAGSGCHPVSGTWGSSPYSWEPLPDSSCLLWLLCDIWWCAECEDKRRRRRRNISMWADLHVRLLRGGWNRMQGVWRCNSQTLDNTVNFHNISSLIFLWSPSPPGSTTTHANVQYLHVHTCTCLHCLALPRPFTERKGLVTLNTLLCSK